MFLPLWHDILYFSCYNETKKCESIQKEVSPMGCERIENMAGGKGHVLRQQFLTEDQMYRKNRVFAKMTIEPGCSLGYHIHHGDAEAYYILSGEGEYDDNGSIRTVKAGDVTYTPDGKGHSIENKSTADLVFIALVTYN